MIRRMGLADKWQGEPVGMADTRQGTGPDRHKARTWAWQTNVKELGLADTRQGARPGRHTARRLAWQTHGKKLGLAQKRT